MALPFTTYGVIGLGNVCVAIDAQQIREVVPISAPLRPLPMSSSAACRSICLRGKIFPVIPIEIAFGLAEDVRSTGVLVIIASNDRVLGISADRLHGMVRVPKDLLGLVKSECSGSFEVFEHEGRAIRVLDVEQLLSNPNIPVGENGVERRVAKEKCENHEIFLLCGYGERRFAVPAELVDATLPMTTLHDSPLVHGYCDGFIVHQGGQVPIVDTLQVLGLGENFSRPERSAGVILRLSNSGLLGFEMDSFVGMVSIDVASLDSVPPVVSTRSDFFKGVFVDASGRDFLVIDRFKVLSESALSDLSVATISSNDTGFDVSKQPFSADLFVVFEAGARLACPISDVKEIIRVPSDLLYADAADNGFVGTFVHRGEIIPVFSLVTLSGGFAFYDENDAAVIIVSAENQAYGFMVERLVSVERARLVVSRSDVESLSGDRFGIDGGVVELRGSLDLIGVADIKKFAAASKI